MNLFNNLGDALLLVENEKGIIEMGNSKFLEIRRVRGLIALVIIRTTIGYGTTFYSMFRRGTKRKQRVRLLS